MRKRMISSLLVLCLAMTLIVPASAVTLPSQENSEATGEKIVISSLQELEALSARDEAEYNGYIEAIDSELKADFNAFIELYPEYISKSAEELVPLFIAENPEYTGSNIDQLENDISLLATNPVVVAVRNFFSNRGYELSLALFNHSLTSNPAAAELTLVGNTAGIYGHIKTELRNESDFYNELVRFSRASTSPYRDTTWGYYFDDMSTDMYWAIRRADVVRNRTEYNKVHFRIVDEYDFDPQTIPGIVAGQCNSNPFHVEIYGVIQNGNWT